MSAAAEEATRKAIDNLYKKDEEQREKIVPSEKDEAFVVQLKELSQSLIDGDAARVASSPLIDNEFDAGDPELSGFVFLKPIRNPYLRRIMYETLDKRIAVERCADGRSGVKFMDAQTSGEWEAISRGRHLRRLRCDTGLRLILELIASKPVVGHHMFLDALHLSKVISGSVDTPATLQEFRALVAAKLFRQGCVDTKHLAESLFGKEFERLSSVDQLYTAVGNVVPVSGPVFGDAKFHDASFDAYATGRCFLGLCQKKDNANWEDVFNANRGKLHLRSSKLQFLDLDATDDPRPDCSSLVTVCGFPEKWSQSDVLAFVKLPAKTRAYWRDSRTVVLDAETADAARTAVEQCALQSATNSDVDNNNSACSTTSVKLYLEVLRERANGDGGASEVAAFNEVRNEFGKRERKD